MQSTDVPINITVMMNLPGEEDFHVGNTKYKIIQALRHCNLFHSKRYTLVQLLAKARSIAVKKATAEEFCQNYSCKRKTSRRIWKITRMNFCEKSHMVLIIRGQKVCANAVQVKAYWWHIRTTVVIHTTSFVVPWPKFLKSSDFQKNWVRYFLLFP